MKNFINDILTKIPIQVYFILVGSLNTAIGYVIYLILLYVLGAKSYQSALALSWFLTSFIAFTTQKLLVFKTKGNWFSEYVRCLLAWSISYMLNVVLLEVFVTYFMLNAMIAQLIATCCVTVVTYIMLRYFAFRVKKV